MALQVLYQHAWVVEAHRLVVEQAAAELNRVMELEPRRLVRRARKSGSVRAAEPVHREALHRREQLVGDLASNPAGKASLDKRALERRHLDVVEAAGQRPPEAIPSAGRHA